jgi:hypothetical protein
METLRDEFFTDFGRSLRASTASVFIGAGLSMGEAGLPSWEKLLNPLRERARVPESVKHPPVVAEFV